MLTAEPRDLEQDPPSERPARRASRHPSSLTYRRPLDGVRALAVTAVFAYHAHVPWAQAGFLGVDVFFVLSGYLITALLLAERRREGRIDLRRFWKRRARRLLPAVVVVLAAVAVAVPILAPEQNGRLGGDLAAALGYVSNWRLIFENQSYFEAAGRPPVLQHLWSLAVEEQFYLLWPAVLVLAIRVRPYRRLVKPLLVAAALSAGLMALLFEPYQDPSRVYYGTDTRAAALLVGAALAAATTRWQLVERLNRRARLVLEVAGLLGLAGLVWCVANVNEFDPRLYRGGFLAVAVLSAALVAAAARPGRPVVLGRALGLRPLVWLGRRSYGVYLWFWPVLMFTRPHHDLELTGLPLLALQAGLTLALAAASYRFVEVPARNGAIGRFFHQMRQGPFPSRAAACGLALSLVLAGLGVGAVVGRTGDGTRRAGEVELVSGDGLNAALAARLAAAPTVPPEPTTTVAPTTTAVPEATTTTTTSATVPVTVTVPPTLPAVQAKLTAVGDSVLLGAKPLLEYHVADIVVDATIGRQFAELVSTVRSYKEAGGFGDAVLVHTGNNGPVGAAQFAELMDLLRTVPKVIVVNVKVDRAWQEQNNDVIRSAVPRYPNAVLVDWHALATANPDAFYDDGLHLTPAGIRLFVGAVLTALTTR